MTASSDGSLGERGEESGNDKGTDDEQGPRGAARRAEGDRHEHLRGAWMRSGLIACGIGATWLQVCVA